MSATWETSPLASVLGGRAVSSVSRLWDRLSWPGIAQVPRARDVLFALELMPASLGSWALGTLLSGLSRQET